MSLVVEAAVLLPALLSLVALGIAVARLHISRQIVEAAAASGAREASIARSAADAKRLATARVLALLAQHDLNCQSTSIDVNASELARPAGVPATVRVRVVCLADLGDLVLPGLPGSITLSSEQDSPVDIYRGR